MKYTPPIPDSEFEKMVAPWLKTIRLGENVTVLNMSYRAQLYRIPQLLQQKHILKKYLGPLNDWDVKILDLMTINFDQPVQLIKQIQLAKKSSKQKLIIVLDADKLLEEKSELLGYVNSLPHKKNNCRLLVFFKKNVYLPKYFKDLTLYSNLIQNIFIFPLYQQNVIIYFIKFLCQIYKVKLSEDLIRQIAQKSGGEMWFAKEPIRSYVKTGDIKTIFDGEQIKLRAKILYEEMEQEEKDTLLGIINKDRDRVNKQVLNFFIKTGLVKQTKRKYIVTVPLLVEYIQKQQQLQYEIRLSQNHEIIVNGVLIQGVFSRAQKRLITKLITSKNQIITRQEAALAIWPDSKANNYSDWALDMAINRLRKKIRQLGIGSKKLVTVKNRGYMLIK